MPWEVQPNLRLMCLLLPPIPQPISTNCSVQRHHNQGCVWVGVWGGGAVLRGGGRQVLWRLQHTMQ